MSPELGALIGIETALEQSAKDGWLDLGPVELAHRDERLDFGLGHHQDVGISEESAVDVIDLVVAEIAARVHVLEQLGKAIGQDSGIRAKVCE